MKRSISFIIAVFLSFTLFADAGTLRISGTIQDESGNRLPGVVVILCTEQDSVILAGLQSDTNGNFEFSNLDTGTYAIRLRYTGYQPVILDSIALTDSLASYSVGEIEMTPAAAGLNVVEVVAEIPLFEYSEGKIVVNVEKNSTFANNTLLEVLEKSPGVIIGKDGGVLLNGRSDILFAIDGKQIYVKGQELLNLLRSYPASSIVRIEISSNPPASVDASGSGGMINVITKKNHKDGLNGMINGGYGQGVYPKSNVSAMIGYRTKRLAINANYSLNARRSYSNLVLTRKITYDTAIGTVVSDSRTWFPVVTNSPRISCDYTLTDRSSLSVAASGVHNAFEPSMISEAVLYDSGLVMSQRQRLTSQSADKFGNWSLAAQFVYLNDSTQNKYSCDVECARFFNASIQNQVSDQFDSSDSLIGSTRMMSDQDGYVNILVFKSDYAFTWRKNVRIESGVKSAFVTTDNDNRFYLHNGNEYVPDAARTNHFIYDENINAAYALLTAERKRITWQIGLRTENTNIRGKEVVTGRNFDRSYWQLFPSGELSYRINDELNLSCSFSRRIDRPGYKFLNPFRYSIDAMSYDEGNPYLKPQTTENFELGFSLLNKALFSAGLSRTENVISQFIRLNGIEENSTLQTYENVGVYQRAYFNTAYSEKYFKRLSVTISAFGSAARLKPYIQSGGNYKTEYAWSASFSPRLDLGKGYTIEAGLKYCTAQRDGLTLMRATTMLNAGMQRVFAEGRASLSLSYSDLLYKNLLSGVTTSGNVSEDWTNYRDTRVLNVAFTYRFGQGKVIRTKKTSGADDEKERAY